MAKSKIIKAAKASKKVEELTKDKNEKKKVRSGKEVRGAFYGSKE